MSDETAAPESARVESRKMPALVRDLRTLAAEMRLDWEHARGLWDAGFLSFDPDSVVAADESREAEFLFLGTLAATGLSHEVLELLLRGLRRPYAYDIKRIYFDWRARCWRLLPVRNDPEGAFFDLLSHLDPGREGAVLLEIRELIENALDLSRGRRHLFGHDPQPPVSTAPGDNRRRSL